ncbi:GPCR fungal pheromone mating factor, partial [Naematelia encephala]
MRYPDYAIWSFIAFFAVLLPSPWHWRMANIATICLISWVALANLITFADVFIWAENYGDHSPIWCDISSRLLQILNYAIPACSLSQMMRLESVASARRSVISATARTRRMYWEAALCVGFPLLMMAVLSTIEGHRYDIVENIGCRQPQYLSWLTLLLNNAIPMSISILACIYGCLAIRWFLVRRLQFRALLASADSGLNISRYFRLIALAFVEVLVLLASNIAYLVLTLKGDDIRPNVGTSWATVHSNYDLISQYTEASSSVDAYSLNALYIYMTALYSLTFFIFFGMGEEAIAEYAKI